jgi:radical SAM superfamily enzyme YgiQ (UPF0313 family)
MKTLLINPDTPRICGIGGMNVFPLGLGYIAAVLENKQDVEVIDVVAENLNEDSLRKRIFEIAPEIVGITANSLSFQRAIDIAQIVKEIDEGVPVVVGGPHPSVLPTYPLSYDCFDISVYGEGEKTAVELWDRIENGESYSDVRGIAFKEKDKVIVTPRREFIESLDELPFPARHLFPMDKYDEETHLPVLPTYSIISSRGCPYSCTFCSNNVVFGRMYRCRTARSVVDEVEVLVKKYNANGIYFRDDLFTGSKERVIDICSEIMKRSLSIEWECESRVDTVDEEMVEVMKEAGCRLIWFGVESSRQEILDLLNKQITVAQTRQVYSLLGELGVETGASWMIGVPGETVDNMLETIKLASELKAQFSEVNIFKAFPTSSLYEYTKRNKLYQTEVGHGILVPQTNEFNWKKLCEIRGYANRKLNKSMMLRRALLLVKKKSLTPRHVLKGIRYFIG